MYNVYWNNKKSWATCHFELVLVPDKMDCRHIICDKRKSLTVYFTRAEPVMYQSHTKTLPCCGVLGLSLPPLLPQPTTPLSSPSPVKLSRILARNVLSTVTQVKLRLFFRDHPKIPGPRETWRPPTVSTTRSWRAYKIEKKKGIRWWVLIDFKCWKIFE